MSYLEQLQLKLGLLKNLKVKLEKEINEKKTKIVKINDLKNVNKLRIKLQTCKKDIDTCTIMIKEEEMRSLYEEYAKINKIKIRSQAIWILVYDCNIYHHKKMLKNHKVEESGSDECDFGCYWIVGKPFCNCGYYSGWKWNDNEIDFGNIIEYDITETEPAGFAERT